MTDFMNWLVGEKAIPQVPETNLPKEMTAPPAAGAAHMAAGKLLAAKFRGLTLTKDLYGDGAQKNGSPWKIPGAQKYPLIVAELQKMGYTQVGTKPSFQKGAVVVDMGKDKFFTYLYITDDNGASSKELPQG